MTKAKALLLAARPKTLPAAVCPVVAGSALAWRLTHQFSWMLAICTLLSTIAIQVATNYFNDAVDAAKGADTSARLGPVRATAAGLVSRKTMMLAGGIAALVAAAFSAPLIMYRGWPIVVIGVVSLFFSYGYTGGPWPLAYRGLGELFVLLFFGLVAVTGTVFVHTGEWRSEGLLLGVQIGSLSTALIAINNLRDIEEDRRSGKRTLAVRFGVGAAKWMTSIWCLLPYPAAIFWKGEALLPGHISFGAVHGLRHLLFDMPLPVAVIAFVILVQLWRTPPSPAYNKLLALSALHLLIWTTVFTWVCLKYSA